jgi:hypothetical protein
MSAIDKSGPAFPRGPIGEDCGQPYGHQVGLTKREYIAAEALPQAVEDYDRLTRGVMDTKMNVLPWACKEMGTREEIIARQAVRYADALLAALEAKP